MQAGQCCCGRATCTGEGCGTLQPVNSNFSGRASIRGQTHDWDAEKRDSVGEAHSRPMLMRSVAVRSNIMGRPNIMTSLKVASFAASFEVDSSACATRSDPHTLAATTLHSPEQMVLRIFITAACMSRAHLHCRPCFQGGAFSPQRSSFSCAPPPVWRPMRWGGTSPLPGT